MKKILLGLTLAALCLLPRVHADETPQIGYVNFKECLEKSKYGASERNAFESLKKQMGETLEKTDKELAEIAGKLEDQDYMDSLSPTAEEELKTRFQALSQEFAGYQNQYYQILNQANMRMVQNLHDHVSAAAEKVRKERKLALILSEDSAFAIAPSYNFTDEVVKIMDQQFQSEKGKEGAPKAS